MAVIDDKDLLRDEYYRSHLETYKGFVVLVKYGTIAVAVVLILMALFLL